jgi:YVTN family beta-propeller protein
VSVINLTTNTVVATIAAANSTDALDSFVHGHPNFIAVTAGTPTGKVYVTSPDSNDLSIIRTDTDAIETHISLQGTGVMVRVNAP